MQARGRINDLVEQIQRLGRMSARVKRNLVRHLEASICCLGVYKLVQMVSMYVNLSSFSIAECFEV